MNKKSRIYIAGLNKFIGQSIKEKLYKLGYINIIDPLGKLVLNSEKSINSFFKKHLPEHVFIVSGMSGGILVNTKLPATLMHDNLFNQLLLIQSSHKYNVKKMLYLAASCVYPAKNIKPSLEQDLLEGKLESSNQSYALAKITGIELCRAYRLQYGVNFFSVIPTNTFGPESNFNENSHVISSLIKKIDQAKKNNKKKIRLWGTGKPIREFIYVKDLADACVFLMKNKKRIEMINVGSDQIISINNLAKLIKNIIGFKGKIEFGSNKFEGTSIKILNSKQLLKLGWKSKTDLKYAIEQTYKYYLSISK